MTTTIRRLLILLVGAVLAASGGVARAQSAPQSIVLASTTSLQDSGLLDTILPKFTAETGITVRVIAQGTGQALAGPRTGFLKEVRTLQDAVSSIAETHKPVIAAVSGWCIGGGVDVISAADIRLASAEARFSLREVKVAIVADLGSLQRLPKIIGLGHVAEAQQVALGMLDAARAFGGRGGSRLSTVHTSSLGTWPR